MHPKLCGLFNQQPTGQSVPFSYLNILPRGYRLISAICSVQTNIDHMHHYYALGARSAACTFSLSPRVCLFKSVNRIRAHLTICSFSSLSCMCTPAAWCDATARSWHTPTAEAALTHQTSMIYPDVPLQVFPHFVPDFQVLQMLPTTNILKYTHIVLCRSLEPTLMSLYFLPESQTFFFFNGVLE